MPINLKDFRRNLIYEVTAPAPIILRDLNVMATIDRIAEAKQKRFTKMLIGFIVGAFLSIFLASVLNKIGVVLLIGFAIAAIYAGIMRIKHKHLNLQNQRYELLKKILEMLGRDMENNTKVNVHLVLSPPTQKNKRINTIPHPYQSGFKIDLFRDEWLKLQGQFLDKTHFILTATELYQTKYGWKRSRSGKSKYKSKSKPKGLEFSLELTCSRRRYGAIKVLQNKVTSAVKLPDKILVKRLKVTDKEMKLTTKMPPSYLSGDSTNLVYRTITMMYFSLYQVLNLAKLLSKK